MRTYANVYSATLDQQVGLPALVCTCTHARLCMLLHDLRAFVRTGMACACMLFYMHIVVTVRHDDTRIYIHMYVPT